MVSSKEQFDRELLENLDALYRIALHFTRNPISAEDLVQESCYRAIRSRDTYDPAAGGMKPWLVRIVRNTFLSRIEREGKQPQAMDDAALDMASPTELSPGQPPTNSHKFSEYMDQELVRALDSLPEEYRTVLVLWALEDFTYQEIALALNVPIGTVMSRLHRARAKLTAQLGEYARRERKVRE